jgi:hypothetical protein
MRCDAARMMRGMGVKSVDGHPLLAQCWLMDDGLYDPDGAGTTTLDHVRERWTKGVYHKP